MKTEFEKLTDDQKAILIKRVKPASEIEVEDWFTKDEKVVKFKAHVKTERYIADILDIDIDENEDESVLFDIDSIENEQKLDEVRESISNYEIQEITLIAPEDFDYEPKISKKEKTAAKVIEEDLESFSEYFSEDKLSMVSEDNLNPEAEMAGLPAVVDHRNNQSPIKNQSRRGTCVSHAALACLEAFDHIPDNLSEQYTHYKFNEFLNRVHNQDQGLRTTDSAGFLARSNGKICLESQWPYISSQGTINNLVQNGQYGPPPSATQNQDFGISNYKIIGDNGLSGESIRNTRYLEALVYQDYNIVIGTWVSWRDSNNDGILEPRFNTNGSPIRRGGHAMLLVGYNRNEQYFILKNSWGNGWGQNGYAFLSYDYVRTYFKYGYVVKGVTPSESENVPARLSRAPYSSSKINRSSLRSAIIALKTSSGRYAIAEAYAGYNLYLKNLVVYNNNGSIHLRKERLVIRGTYLCDIDSGRETRNNADFWWEAVSSGVNNLVPRNGAKACVLYNISGLRANNIRPIRFSSSPVPSAKLNFAVIAGITTANKTFKAVMHLKPGNKLFISYLEVFNTNGTRYKYKQDIEVSSSWTYNLDTLRQGGGKYADIWWHVISNNVGFIEKYSTAKFQLLFCI